MSTTSCLTRDRRVRWTNTQILQVPGVSLGSAVGNSLSVHGTKLAVAGSAAPAGAVYVFENVDGFTNPPPGGSSGEVTAAANFNFGGPASRPALTR